MINCLSSSCAFNKSGTCSSSVVKIEGFDACVTPETYCKSFIESSDNSNMINSIDTYDPSSQGLICSANNCIFNFANCCKSGNIHINYSNNTCETFKKRSSNYQY